MLPVLWSILPMPSPYTATNAIASITTPVRASVAALLVATHAPAGPIM